MSDDGNDDVGRITAKLSLAILGEDPALAARVIAIFASAMCQQFGFSVEDFVSTIREAASFNQRVKPAEA